MSLIAFNDDLNVPTEALFAHPFVIMMISLNKSNCGFVYSQFSIKPYGQTFLRPRELDYRLLMQYPQIS